MSFADVSQTNYLTDQIDSLENGYDDDIPYLWGHRLDKPPPQFVVFFVAGATVLGVLFTVCWFVENPYKEEKKR